jgi:hypothetical protein
LAPSPLRFKARITFDWTLCDNSSYVTSSLAWRWVCFLWIRLALQHVIWLQNFFQIIYKNSIRTSQETHYVSATKTSRLMLFTKTVTAYCENHTKHINTLCEDNAGF